MENPEETLQMLEEWATRRARSSGGNIGALPRQLDEYLAHVARTGDPIFQWVSVKPLIKEKLLNAVNEFHETAPGLDIPLAPNVDPFNYEAMRSLLLERLDSFNAAPFTVQRLCELLTAPRKQYNRIDKFMRAVEKNVLVVSTREPGVVRREETESIERALNGSDGNSDCGVDVDMEEASWREIRHPVVDPLSGPVETARPVDVPRNATTVTPSDQPSTRDEKMDETPDPPEDSKPVEVAETKENGEKTEEINMEVDTSKENCEEQPVIQEEPISETKHKEPAAAPPSSSSEDDSNSNPETTTLAEQPTDRELEHKTGTTTSGEESSSSNSSENTDGEAAEECTARSPEQATPNEGEGDHSSDTPSHKQEEVPSESIQPDKEDKPPLIESENYTIADIQTTAPSELPVEEKALTTKETEPVTQQDDQQPDNIPEEVKITTTTTTEETAQAEPQKDDETTS